MTALRVVHMLRQRLREPPEHVHIGADGGCAPHQLRVLLHLPGHIHIHIHARDWGGWGKSTRGRRYRRSGCCRTGIALGTVDAARIPRPATMVPTLFVALRVVEVRGDNDDSIVDGRSKKTIKDCQGDIGRETNSSTAIALGWRRITLGGHLRACVEISQGSSRPNSLWPRYSASGRVVWVGPARQTPTSAAARPAASRADSGRAGAGRVQVLKWVVRVLGGREERREGRLRLRPCMGAASPTHVRTAGRGGGHPTATGARRSTKWSGQKNLRSASRAGGDVGRKRALYWSCRCCWWYSSRRTSSSALIHDSGVFLSNVGDFGRGFFGVDPVQYRQRHVRMMLGGQIAGGVGVEEETEKSVSQLLSEEPWEIIARKVA
ncbi:hypothetical protein DFH06DRAFT_1119477 [Mycena polygramma]|nr:hypothetical protein DFH06DRAFT_1119477 [Mycena polygramma]